jgi:hypothetical protein
VNPVPRQIDIFLRGPKIKSIFLLVWHARSW